ncbi:MAG: hypothetical protein DI528_12845 [Shinella sp.]|nr:MAG: hypothetical protein DI528_12845 [Shinella sp.]
MVTMIDIEEFLPEVLQYAPNTSELVAQTHIVAVARELCDRCKIWRETDTFEIVTPAGQGLMSISNAEIVSIEEADMGGVPMEPVTVAWLDEHRPKWHTDTATGQARYVTQLNLNTVSVYPRQSGEMTARFVLKPARRATELPDFLLQSYSDEIGKGAAGRIHTLPTENAVPQLGVTMTAWFEERLNKLSTKTTRGQQGAPLRTKGRYF